jgi:chromatin remodeling complex protein RSC6
MNSMDAFLRRMNSKIIQWRTYLASLNGDTLVLNNAKVDKFVAMVEHAQKIHREEETDDTPTHKRKREEEETDSDHSPTFKREMEHVDENMHRAPPRASQRMETRAQATARCLEFELANLNALVVHEIGESSSTAIMEISDSE